MYDGQCMKLKEMNIIFILLIIFSIGDSLINLSTWREKAIIAVYKLNTYWRPKNNCYPVEVSSTGFEWMGYP